MIKNIVPSYIVLYTYTYPNLSTLTHDNLRPKARGNNLTALILTHDNLRPHQYHNPYDMYV